MNVTTLCIAAAIWSLPIVPPIIGWICGSIRDRLTRDAEPQSIIEVRRALKERPLVGAAWAIQPAIEPPALPNSSDRLQDAYLA